MAASYQVEASVAFQVTEDHQRPQVTEELEMHLPIFWNLPKTF
jgi:hypothetical protein